MSEFTLGKLCGESIGGGTTALMFALVSSYSTGLFFVSLIAMVHLSGGCSKVYREFFVFHFISLRYSSCGVLHVRAACFIVSCSRPINRTSGRSCSTIIFCSWFYLGFILMWYLEGVNTKRVPSIFRVLFLCL